MRKKFFVLTLIMILFVSLLSVTASATTDDKKSFNLAMTANNTRVAPGGEVLITVKITNLQVGETGVNSFYCYLTYNTDVFEQLTESSIDGVDGWKPSFNLQTNKIDLSRTNFLKNDGEIMQISLKTKENIADSTVGEIKLTGITLSNGADEFQTTPSSTSITVSESSGGQLQPVNNSSTRNFIQRPGNTLTLPTNNTTVLPANNTTPLPVENNTTNNTSNDIVVVNETDDDMPYTGTESDALARIIVGIIFIALVIYIKLERMNREVK